MEDEIDFDKTFYERNIYVLLYNLRHVIHIPYFRIANLLNIGGHFINTTFIDTKNKCRSPYPLDFS